MTGHFYDRLYLVVGYDNVRKHLAFVIGFVRALKRVLANLDI